MILSSKILNFHVRFEYLKDYLIANRERFGYTDLHMERLNSLWEEWKITFPDYCNPATNSDYHAGAMNKLYDKCYKLVTSLKKRAISPFVELTALDKAFLETNTNTKSRGKIPVTDYAPCLVCLEITKNFCKFFALDPKHLNTKRKPEGADKVGIMIAYTAKDAPEPEAKEYKKLNPEKKSIFEVIIPADKSEMVLYIKVYYISPTGEEGKVSNALLVKLI